MCFLLLALVGCSPSPFDAEVAGAITLDGETIGPGVVIFAPGDAKVNPSKGNIDTRGRYVLNTKHEQGIDSGVYRVAVQVFDTSNPPAPGERQWESPKPLVPEKYLKVATSGLEYTVAPGSNTIDIALVSD